MGEDDYQVFPDGHNGSFNDSYDYYDYEQHSVCDKASVRSFAAVFLPLVYGLTLVLGLAGNSLVVLVYSGRGGGHLRTLTDVCLLNLAAADLLLLVTLPLWAAAAATQGWHLGAALCKLTAYLYSATFSCSMFLLACVSADRYLAVTRPLSSHRGAGPGRGRQVPWAHALCLGVWALGALLSLPALLFRTVRSFPELGVDACVMQYPHGGWRMRYNLTFNLVGFLIPVPVVSFCTYHICRVLRESRALRGRSCREQTTAAVAVERKAAYLVMVVLAIFVLCWLPYQIIVLLDSLDYYQVISGCTWAHVLDIGVQLATYLGYSNSALNPFLYVIVGKHFKQRAREVFRQTLCRRRWRKTAGNSNSSTLRYTDSTKV